MSSLNDMTINLRQWLNGKRITLAIVVSVILIAALSHFFHKVPEQPVLRGQDDFFQRYEQAVSELRSGKVSSPVLPDKSSGELASHVVSLASYYAVDPEVRNSTAELLELSVERAAPESVIHWLASLRVNYQLHISSIRIILSEDKKTVSIPELTLVKASF